MDHKQPSAPSAIANDNLCGYVVKITFHNSENGYTIAQLKTPKQSDPCCIVGIMPALQPGETVRCIGAWKHHLIYGRQFEVREVHLEAPADIEGIKKYLGSGLIKGIGPVYAKRIVEKFGTDTLAVIDQTPEKLYEIDGLGKKRANQISACWGAQKSIRQVMIFLQSHGISPSFAQKVYKAYGEQSIEKVKNNPFHLARDIFGIGFKTADTIAQKMGIARDSPHRVEAGIEYILSQLSSDGHVCYPLADFLNDAMPLLEVSKDFVEERITALAAEGRIEKLDMRLGGQSQPFVWLKSLFVSETGIAREIKRLNTNPSSLRQIDTTKAIDWVQKKLNIQLAAEQQKAVKAAQIDKLHIITGGPGTGKSTITKAILSIAQHLTSKILLAAPTGRAAKRMSEITGRKAVTIHSLLEVNPRGGGFKRNRDNPLEVDLLIIDEASMIDTYLMYALLKAIPSHCRTIFVGDVNQLPSVGPGNVLNDLITTMKIPVTRLNEIFRQAAGSRIITNAHLINKGSFPDISNRNDSDFFFIEADEAEEALSQVLSLVSQRLPKKYGFNPISDIQVLSPMRKGIIGCENLNMHLQQVLNPKESSGQLFFGRKYIPGDKVMQIRNNYQKEVFNGDVGQIIDIDAEEQQVKVGFEGREVLYEYNELDEIALAYAVSVHKYQGSECPCIVIPIHTSHYKMLHRNLLYTAVTRGRKLVAIVGTKKAVFMAVKTDDVKKRYTGLQEAIHAIC